MSRLYEVVDDAGNPTGELLPSQEIHARGLKVRYAQVYLFNSKGEMLVQQRSRKAGLRPNKLDPSAAGHVEVGQSFEECAYMEMEEEVGVKTPLERLFRYDGYWGVAEVFKGVWDGGIVTQEEELERADWVSPEALDTVMRHMPWLVSDGFVSSYEIFRGWKKNG